ncbi:MAG TPA: urate hydroxylase PuuD [Verrucomicrobiae bacterium]|jgi:uncharacterized membrane protein|nr:urate hydroxylase PuuD [Verrucomicrobiae bacterium]
MWGYVLDWLNLIVRWFHMVAGVSWIGASFYFIWLDDRLTKPRDPQAATAGVSGELWAVHGGGFYHNQKYLTGPTSQPLPLDLHWFKWEAYLTWISGIAMMAIVYWAGAGTFLIDKTVLDITPPVAIAISIASMVVGWLVYDVLCRVLERRPLLLGVAIYAALVLASYGLFHIFGARAAYIHVGAIVGTIMVANVFFIIIPGQRKMLAQIRDGQTPDPRPGQIGKIRSVHNSYFTLPVLFIMISNHYPMTYANAYGWLVLAAIGLAGVLVRYFFILSHKDKIVVALPAAAIAILVVVAIAIAPRPSAPAASNVTFAKVAPIFAQRCGTCHAAKPTQPGFSTPPEGIVLDTPAHIQTNARNVYTQAVATHAMPLGNATGMTDAERALVGQWIDGGARI